MKHSPSHRLTTIGVTMVMLFGVLAGGVRGAEAAIKTPNDKFVRTANYYLRAGSDITPSLYPELAKYDLLVFPAEAQVYNRSMFAALRKLNPTIIILAYVPSKSWNDQYWNDSLHQEMLRGIDPSWWLLDPNGASVSVWPGTRVINSVSGWQDYLPSFVNEKIWKTGLWDGVFYDEFSSNASWINGGNVDIHRDGVRDDARLLDVAWERASQNILAKTRQQLGTNAIIVTNGDSTPSLQKDINGRMFESFPTPWEAGGTWAGVMANYLGLQKQVGHDPVFIINGTTRDTGNNADFARVRYSLASTLLADGFFSFDFGETNHGQIWHYDEETVALGSPLGGPTNVDSPADARVKSGVWRRDFSNGLAIVNASGVTRTIALDGEYEKIKGEQDPSVNDGSIVTSVTLPNQDGLLLRRRIETIAEASYPNGAFVRLFSADGAQARNGFFAFDQNGDGAATVVTTDIDGNGPRETVVAGAGRVRVIGSDKNLLTTFSPFGDAYKGGMTVAVGDLDGDGSAEIVVGAGPGGGPHIRIFNKDGRAIHPGWFAYDKNFRGGVNVAIGDIYGTGNPVIIAGAGQGGGPHVRIFNRVGRLLHPGWMAYAPTFKGGVSVAAGDLDGDGKAEIVTGAGPGGSPQVRVFSRTGAAIGKPFYAGDVNSKAGVQVGVVDSDGDGKGEIATYSIDVYRFSATR